MRTDSLCLLVLSLVLLFQMADGAMYKLVLLPQERGAACLDGSPPGIYIHEGTGANRTKYLIYFNGGGFCGGSTIS